MILSITGAKGNQGGSLAKRKGRPPKIDECGRGILREIVTAQPHATLDEVTAEFMRRTELTVNPATVLKAQRQAGARRGCGQAAVTGAGRGPAAVWLYG